MPVVQAAEIPPVAVVVAGEEVVVAAVALEMAEVEGQEVCRISSAVAAVAAGSVSVAVAAVLILLRV